MSKENKNDGYQTLQKGYKPKQSRPLGKPPQSGSATIPAPTPTSGGDSNVQPKPTGGEQK